MPTRLVIQELETNLCFTANDRVFLGEGLFETVRVVKNKPCYAEAHWQRLKKSASFLGLEFNVSFGLWHAKLKECIQQHSLQEGGIKAILCSGSAPRGLSAHSRETSLILNAFQFVQSSQSISLRSAPWQRDAKNPIYQLKSINYLEAILARRQAEAAGFDDVLFFNLQNQVMETSVANFFVIKNDQLITPSLSCGILPGIIRERILFLSKKQRVQCFEQELISESLVQADAAFTCNALQGIRPVHALDNHVFKEENHPIMAELNRLLAVDLANSIAGTEKFNDKNA